MLFGREPALWLTAVHMAIALAIGFGLKLSVEQFAMIEAFVAAVIGLIIRQSVTPLSGAARGGGVGLMVLLLSAILFVTPAQAVTGNVLDIQRATVGVNVGAVYYESNDAAKPTQQGIRVEPFLSWSLSDELSAVAKAGFDPKYGRERYAVGLRGSVYGHEPIGTPMTRRLQAGLAFDRVWYRGDGADFYAATESWQAGISLGWIVLATEARDWIALKPQFSYDNLNGYEVMLGLGAQY